MEGMETPDCLLDADDHGVVVRDDRLGARASSAMVQP